MPRGEGVMPESGGGGVWFVNSGREHLVAIREFKHRTRLSPARAGGDVCGAWSLLMLQFLCSCVSC